MVNVNYLTLLQAQEVDLFAVELIAFGTHYDGSSRLGEAGRAIPGCGGTPMVERRHATLQDAIDMVREGIVRQGICANCKCISLRKYIRSNREICPHCGECQLTGPDIYLALYNRGGVDR